MYRVLRPAFARSGEVLRTRSGHEIRWERVTWIELGVAKDMQDAKQRFGGSPVLEHIPAVH